MKYALIAEEKTHHPVSRLAGVLDVSYEEMFNIKREVLCVFSSYDRFEPRTLDAFDVAQAQITSDYRLETVCKVLISRDSSTQSQIESFLKSDPESPIVVPFTYAELSSAYDNFFLRNRFQQHLYTRDLFSFQSPLKKDLYFFGRSALVLDLVNRHRTGEHVGLFGLRKCGKTSIIYAIERLMDSCSEAHISFDCEDPSIHQLRWHELLYKIATDYHSLKQSKKPKPDLSRYDEINASQSFQEDVLSYYKSKKQKPILLIFDEIERIAPRTGTSRHWREENDFLLFWQSMRAFYQRYPEILTYMLVGTNPSCVELPIISENDNPLFASIPPLYVPSFTVGQVREMVRKLGRYMGLQFDELFYAKLQEDFGGHPFLIRQVCSQINKSIVGQKPVMIDRAIYAEAKEHFAITSSEYLQMITQVLREWYPDEYDMLCFLAQDDNETFGQLASDNPALVKHLMGYELIQKGRSGYHFCIESVKAYLIEQHKYERLNMTDKEMNDEISDRRNRLERELRSQIKRGLVFKYGRKEALTRAMNALQETRRTELKGYDLDRLFSRDESPLFFKELINIINKEWDVFSPVFEMDRTRLDIILQDINSNGRPDAHAKRLDKDTFTQLRIYFNKLDELISRW